MITINLTISQEAQNFIHEQIKEHSNSIDSKNLILVIYRYTTRSWSGTYCHDMIQLIPEERVMDHQDFEKIEGNNSIKAYVDKSILNQLDRYNKNLKVDLRTSTFFHKKTLVMDIEN